MTQTETLDTRDYCAENIVDIALCSNRRVLLFGAPGIGKSTLAAGLACQLGKAGRPAWCICADPGDPTFGVPGAVCIGEWQGGHWALVDLQALCSLDAGRFRLPLVSAVRSLAQRQLCGTLFVDAPGVIRGVAGAELLAGLVEAADIDLVLALTRHGQAPPLPSELKAANVETFMVQASPQARRLTKQQRAGQRTARWDTYLRDAGEYQVPLSDVQLIGTPPPIDVDSAWTGRQVALLDGSRTVMLGEVLSKDGNSLRICIPRGRMESKVLLVRDARRTEHGLLRTAKPFASSTSKYVPPPNIEAYSQVGNVNGPCPVARVGAATATLVNGIFGDPLLHLRLSHEKRSLLFDLGEGGRLPGRIAHQVTDVFISHAHIDHIGGFLWLLRSRIGDFPACRVFGPSGLSEHIQGLVSGIRWDRIGANGPRFEIAELHDQRLLHFAVQAGRKGVERLGDEPVRNGVVLDEPSFRVRAIALDHGTPVLAFAFEQPRQFNVRKDGLTARGLAVGPWLRELKQRLADNDRAAPICLPDGRVKPAGVLADDLILIMPGQKLVYATDLADTLDNRERLTALAKGAHTFFCEAAFVQANANQASRTGHLTARACGEIATAAHVQHLIPFHFSRRYENEAQRVYDEVRAVCSHLVVPQQKDGFSASSGKSAG